MQNFKAVFVDIDGTIVFNRQLVSSALTAVRRLKETGIRVALCTGRAILHTQEVQHALGLHDAVYFNGGLAITEGEVTLSQPLDKDVTERALEASVELDLPVILHARSNMYTVDDVPHHLQSLLDDFQYPHLTKIDFEALLSKNASIYQMNVFMRSHMDEVMNRVVPECLIYRWHPEAVDLQRLGCDKSLGAMSLLERWNIPPEQAIHFGDGGNDIGMFHTVGMPVAMGNASEDVKKHAAYVTDSVENHGVLKALEHLGVI